MTSREEKLLHLLRRAANVMKGPADAVHNDNGDITVTGFNIYEAAKGCYFVRRDIVKEIGEAP